MFFSITSKTKFCPVPCLTTTAAYWPFDADAVPHRPPPLRLRSLGVHPFGRSRLYPPPPAWFLPGPKRMRGGAARRFASGSGFCGGIHSKSTWRNPGKKVTKYQSVTKSRSCCAGFFCQIHQIQFAKSTRPNPAEPRRPFGPAGLSWTSDFHRP